MSTIIKICGYDKTDFEEIKKKIIELLSMGDIEVGTGITKIERSFTKGDPIEIDTDIEIVFSNEEVQGPCVKISTSSKGTLQYLLGVLGSFCAIPDESSMNLLH